MKLLAQNSKMMTAALLAATLGLAACGRVEAPAAAATMPIVQVALMEEGGGTGLPVVVERRHFAIYNTYRVLFDDSAKVFTSGEQTQGEGLQHAVDSDAAVCSMHASLLDD